MSGEEGSSGTWETKGSSCAAAGAGRGRHSHAVSQAAETESWEFRPVSEQEEEVGHLEDLLPACSGEWHSLPCHQNPCPDLMSPMMAAHPLFLHSFTS